MQPDTQIDSAVSNQTLNAAILGQQAHVGLMSTGFPFLDSSQEAQSNGILWDKIAEQDEAELFKTIERALFRQAACGKWHIASSVKSKKKRQGMPERFRQFCHGGRCPICQGLSALREAEQISKWRHEHPDCTIYETTVADADWKDFYEISVLNKRPYRAIPMSESSGTRRVYTTQPVSSRSVPVTCNIETLAETIKADLLTKAPRARRSGKLFQCKSAAKEDDTVFSIKSLAFYYDGDHKTHQELWDRVRVDPKVLAIQPWEAVDPLHPTVLEIRKFERGIHTVNDAYSRALKAMGVRFTVASITRKVDACRLQLSTDTDVDISEKTEYVALTGELQHEDMPLAA